MNAEEYWKQLLLDNDKNINTDVTIYRLYDIENNIKKRLCLDAANRIDKRIDNLVLIGLVEKAKEYAELGIKYIINGEMKNNRKLSFTTLDPVDALYLYKYFRYRFDWLLSGKENEGIAAEALNIIHSQVQDRLLNFRSCGLRCNFLIKEVFGLLREPKVAIVL